MVWKHTNWTISKQPQHFFQEMFLFMKLSFLSIILIFSFPCQNPMIFSSVIQSSFQHSHNILILYFQIQPQLRHILMLPLHRLIPQLQIFQMKVTLLFALQLKCLSHHISYISVHLLELSELPHIYKIIIAIWCLEYLFPSQVPWQKFQNLESDTLF